MKCDCARVALAWPIAAISMQFLRKCASIINSAGGTFLSLVGARAARAESLNLIFIDFSSSHFSFFNKVSSLGCVRESS